MKHREDLILLINSKVVLLARGEVTDATHGHPEFLPGFFYKSGLAGFDLAFIIGKTPESRSELFDRDNRLVIQRAAIQETAEALKDADHFEGVVPNQDLVAQRRFFLEQVGGDLIADDTNRAPA